ncbi:nuclear transport factor 2 family protein [Flagellimonas sp. DF-77]|uniref:nuclear transport factor 2 family protein n=1 Tax=Flagellimonas algarum TaxID=3230298 RepID=UPI003399D981
MKATLNTNSEDRQAIGGLIEQLFSATDARDWAAVKATMHDSVYTDYTALGGDAGFKSPDEIVKGWQQLLPGFERTVHQPHNLAFWVADDRATATLDALATHYLNHDYWSVFVGYDTEFIKRDGNWYLARIDLSNYAQVGAPELIEKAIDNVSQNRIPPLTPAQDTATIDAFFSALEAQDLEAVLATLDAQVVQEMPFAPEGFPTRVEGIEAMRKQYSGVMGYTQSYEREYFGTADPNVILVKFEGTITTSEGKPYNNSYIGSYTLGQDGKIIKFIEQFNPNTLLNGWPGLQPLTFSVHQAGAPTNSGVQQQEVFFPSNGVQLKGHLFTPPHFEADNKYPVAIVTGSWTSVKEQMPDEYASLLAQQGIMALTFDFTGFGESEGQPRYVEDSKLKIADIKAAIDFIVKHPNTDPEAITGLGVCASSGYMAHATAEDPRIKKLVLVAPWLHNPEIAKMIYDMRPGGTEGLLQAAKQAKQRYADTGRMPYVLAASELDPLSAMYVPENAFDYYLNPAKAAGPHYANLFAVSSWEPWLTFDGISVAKNIDQPVFIVHSESGAVPQGAQRFYDLLNGEKTIKWLNAYDQQQLYFESEAVNAAIGEVVDYLK